MDDPTLPVPGLVARVGAGMVGGQAGGVVFGILMQVTGMLSLVAGLVGHESLLVGWAVHMAIAVFVGATYALLFGLAALVPVLAAALGLFYGLVWWLLGGLTLLPLRLGLGLFVFDATAWQGLAGHVGYGLVLGLVYAVVGNRWSGERGGHRAAGPPPTGTGAPPTGTGASGPAAGRLTGLPADARRLRQRQRSPGPDGGAAPPR